MPLNLPVMPEKAATLVVAVFFDPLRADTGGVLCRSAFFQNRLLTHDFGVHTFSDKKIAENFGNCLQEHIDEWGVEKAHRDYLSLGVFAFQ